MRDHRRVALIGFLLTAMFVIGIARAQSVPNGGTITQGEIWTPAQWMAAWQSKLDLTGTAANAPFSGITSGTNNNALVTDGSITRTGSGHIDADEINSAAIPASLPAVGTNSAGQFIAAPSPGNYITGVDITGATDVSAAINAQLATATAAGVPLRCQAGAIYGIAGPIIAPTDKSDLDLQGCKIRELVSNTGSSSAIFKITGTVNSTNITQFLVENADIDGGMPVRGSPPNTPGTGTDANVSQFTACTGTLSCSGSAGTSLFVSAVASGTLYVGHTVFDIMGPLAGLGAPSNLTITAITGGATTNQCNVGDSACTVTLSAATSANVATETAYTTNHIALIQASAAVGYGKGSLYPFGCDQVIFRNVKFHNFAGRLGNIQGCTRSKIENVLMDNGAAGGNNYQLTANLATMSWNAASTSFSPSSPVSSGASSVTLAATTVTCGIYFAFVQNPSLQLTIAETTPNQNIINGTVVTGATASGCTVTGTVPNETINATGTITLALSQATIGSIATTGATIKVYDLQPVGNAVTALTCTNFGSCTIDIVGQSGFDCSHNRAYGSYALGNVTGSGGGNSLCYAQGSSLPGNIKPNITDNIAFQITGNCVDDNVANGDNIVGNIFFQCGRSGISVTSNGVPAAENPLGTATGFNVDGNISIDSNYSTSTLFQTGFATVNTTQTGTSGSPLTSLAVTGVSGTCAAGSYVVGTGMSGYPYPVGTSGAATIFGSGWANGNVTLSTGLIGTVTGGTALVCSTRNPSVIGALDSGLTLGCQPNSAVCTVMNGTIGTNILGDDQFATTPTATLTTSALTSSGPVLTFASTTGVANGQQVYCPGTQPFAIVTSFVANTSVTLNQPVVVGGVASGAVCYFFAPQPTMLYGIDVAPNTALQNIQFSPAISMYGASGGNLSAAALTAITAGLTNNGIPQNIVTTANSTQGVTHGTITVCLSGAAVTHTGDSSETLLYSCAIPAGILGTNGLLNIIPYWSRTATTTDTVQFNVRFATANTCCGGTQYMTYNDATTSVTGQQTATIIRNANSASAQYGYQSAAPAGSLTGTETSQTTSAVNTANASYINFTCKDTTSTGDTCGIYGILVEATLP